jgi:hypothetical protein
MTASTKLETTLSPAVRSLTAIEFANDLQSQPRRGNIFVVTAPEKRKLRRSDIVSFMPPLRGFGDWARRFYKDATPTEFTETRPDHFSLFLLFSMAVHQPSPLGRGRSCCRLFRESAAGFAQTAFEFLSVSNRCSLSPRERVRVRGKGAWNSEETFGL